MFAAIFSIILGVCGWLIAKLLFEPTKEILDLRREVQESLIIYGDLSKDAPLDERRAAAEAFGRVGAGLSSRHIAAYPWVRWCFGHISWDIHGAGVLFLALPIAHSFRGSVTPTSRRPLPRLFEVAWGFLPGRAATRNTRAYRKSRSISYWRRL